MARLQEEDILTVKISITSSLNDDGTNTTTNEQDEISVNPSTSIEAIFQDISDKITQSPDEIEIIFKTNGKDHTILNSLREKTLQEANLWPVTNSELLVVSLKNRNMSLYVNDTPEDELHLGASASPTTGDATTNYKEFQLYELYPFDSTNEAGTENNNNKSSRRRTAQLSPIAVESVNYVGLVNQAMTCYLNSLLQALYMTPEFRNALYNWEFDGSNESRNIPYQLQKLFLNLQTSTKSAVETTDLTTSFGWQGSDAWHQHDIQELCRVMFDALEQKFKDTKQANLINDHYQGKMLDYVKCLECGTEKSREDTFLDIPLPVRPFGSTVAYNSVEEALRAFVQPETLDGNNQYFCEKCNKKCDAHKGFKFTKFPYLFTLHLKRFDFDYNTMHRIKLNDKVVFSETLNLNSFIPIDKKIDETCAAIAETAAKCDDCSTTDSGAADDESSHGTSYFPPSTINGHDDNCADTADSDEGIDVSSGNNPENEAKGPLIYELFSIMIHSGSASGGHYYAYIKDFDKNLWFCFNDQTVSPVTNDDIKKTYGGGPHRSYYSGAYSSSTNAYMLMYRQINKERNCKAMAINEFPPHLEKLLAEMQLKDEEERLNRKKQDDMVKINVWCKSPTTGALQELKISTLLDQTLAEIAQHAYNRFKLEDLVNVEDCRMVAYHREHKCIYCSFESDEITYQEALKASVIYCMDWMLEIREPGTEWKNYQLGGINMQTYPIILETEDIQHAVTVRVDVGETVGTLKKELGEILNVDSSILMVIMVMYSNEPKFLKEDTDIVHFDSKCSNYRLYVAAVLDLDPETTKCNMIKFKKLVDLYSYVISLNVVLPDTDEGTLESLSIPSIDLNQNNNSNNNCETVSSPNLRVSPQPGILGMCGDGYDQSNSEDSSLSDSDRTLIGDAPDYLNSLESPPDLEVVSASVDPVVDNSYNNSGGIGITLDELSWDNPESQQQQQQQQQPEQQLLENFYFKIVNITEYRDIPLKQCLALVDKRMTVEILKKNFESILGVPSEYFKVFKHHHVEDEWTRLKDTLRSLKDGEKLTLKLGRVLKENEQQFKVFYLINGGDPNHFLFEHIITKFQTVESAKRDILHCAKKQNLLDIPYNRCRLREKTWKKPKTVFLDDQKFGDDILIPYNNEIYLQELSEPETVTSSNQTVVYLKKFSPSELVLGSFQEIVLDLLTMENLRAKIAEISNIPVENIDVAAAKGSYPYDVHILEIRDEQEWNPKVCNLEPYPLNITSGSMFFYKDNRELLKELTAQERKEIRQKEDARLGRVSVTTSGKERALKIYLYDTTTTTTSTSSSKIDYDVD